MPQKLYLEVKNMRKKTFGGSIRNRTRDREISHLNRGINDSSIILLSDLSVNRTSPSFII